MRKFVGVQYFGKPLTLYPFENTLQEIKRLAWLTEFKKELAHVTIF